MLIQNRSIVWAGLSSVLAPGVVLASALCSAAFADGEPAFHARFDGALDVNGSAPVEAANLSFTAGIEGEAVYIPTNGWLEYSFDASYLKSGEGTVLFWAKTDWAYTGCCTYRDHALNDDGVWDDLSSSKLNRSFFLLGDWRGIRLTATSTFSCWYVEAWGNGGTRGRIRPGEWHQYALSYDRKSGRFRIYIDGYLLDEKLFPESVEGIFPKTFTVGCGGRLGQNRDYGPRLGLAGAMDELRLYPRELTTEEVRADYVRHLPYRMELLDWSVGEGESRQVRLRVRNISSSEITRSFAFNTGETVTLTLAPDELKECTVTVRGDKPGLFSLACNEGQSDYDEFQLYCLPGEMGENESGNQTIQQSTSQTLLGEYDCTRDYPTNVFNECGSTIVTDSPCGAYREGVRFNPGTGFLYRFDIKHKGRPHRLEIDYPDDAKREFSFGVWHENYGRLHTGSLDCGGILTGVDHPLTMKMQTKSLLFWPDSDAISAGIMAYKAIDGSRPPAVARVRLYELGDLPSAPNAGAASTRRTVGVWDEDPTMDAQLVLNHAVNYKDADLGFWCTKWRRTIDYMRYHGLDTWVIKALSYYGDVTDMQATFKHTSEIQTEDGRCPGWAEIGADMLTRAGMDFWIRYNHKCDCGDWIGALGDGGSTTNYYFLDSDGNVPTSYGRLNFLRPEIRLAMKRIIRAYRDKFKAYGGFRGITMNETPGPYFDSIRIGYDDWTCSLFASETGEAGLPDTASARYEFLVGDKERRARWIAWRCQKVTELAEELTAALREDGGDYELQFWIQPQLFASREKDWFGWTPDESLRRSGVDLNALVQIQGLRVVPMVRPDYFRAHELYDANEPHFPYRASYQKLLREAGIGAMNVSRHSNLEIYPSMTATSNMWLRTFWTNPGYNIGGIPDFYDYPTPHPDSREALVSTVQLIADYDIQDLLHGFWGLPESGEHERFRTLYSQLRAIPRGRFDLASGANEPVAVRVGEPGFYLVNREPYEVTVSWKRNGTAESATLDNCEIRYFPVSDSALEISDVTCEIPEGEREALDGRLGVVEAYARLNPSDRALQDVAARAREAFDAGLYTTARGYLVSASARAATLSAQGITVLSEGEPELVWAHEWDVECKQTPCHWLDSEWHQVGGTAENYAENTARLGTEKVGIAYSLSHDPVRNGLHLWARVSGGTPSSLTFTFDPKNDDAYDEAGFSPDDVTYTLTEAGDLGDGYTGYEAFIPYADLVGFEAKPGAELAYTFVYRATVQDDKGAFTVSIGPDEYGCKLRLSASRTGSTVTLQADSGTYKTEAVVCETPSELTLAFTPEKNATINFGCNVAWGGVARLADLKITGAEVWKTPLDVPCDLIYDVKSLSNYMTVTAGVPVKVVATISVREEWKEWNDPDMWIDSVRSQDGASYVNTGIDPTSGTRVELDFAWLDGSPADFPVVAGSVNASGREIRAIGYEYGVRGYLNGRHSGMLPDKGAMGRYKTVTTFVSGGSTFVQDGVQLDDPPDEEWHTYFGTVGVPDCTGVPLYLFAANRNGTASNFARIALYGAKIWRQEEGEWVLKRDYRPCMKNRRAGLYDAVSKTIAYPASGGDLLSDPHVVYPEKVEGVTPGRQIINAIANSAEGDTILFRRGTYTFAEDEYAVMNDGERQRIDIRLKGLHLMGEDTTSRKTWTEGREPVVIDANGARFARVYGVSGVRFTGLTITGADQTGTWRDPGAAVTLYYSDDTLLSNCVFRGNSAWRGGACGGSTYGGVRCGYYYDCLFKDNKARVEEGQSSGGAIYAAREAKDCDFIGNESSAAGAVEKVPLIERCTFRGNGAFHKDYGCAAVKVVGEDARDKTVIRDCHFEANTNYNHSKGAVVRFEAHSYTNALAMDYGLYVTNCTFKANCVAAANGYPRGVAVSSYAMESGLSDPQRLQPLRSLLVCEDCTFEGNCGSPGCFSGAAAGITGRRCTFKDNATGDEEDYFWGDSVEYCSLFDCELIGGGEINACALTRCDIHDITSRAVFYGYGGHPGSHVTNCLIRNCNTPHSLVKGVSGGAEFVNCTFANNTVGGSAVYEDSGNATNINCVYYGNTNASGKAFSVGAHSTEDKATIRFMNCAFGPGRQAGLLCDAACFDVENPMFNEMNDPSRPYYEPLRNSPLREKGDNALVGFTEDDTDLAGRKRLNGDLLDVGCYQGWSQEATTLVTKADDTVKELFCSQFPERWSDGLLPHANADYRVEAAADTGISFAIDDLDSMAPEYLDDYTFPGSTLALNNKESVKTATFNLRPKILTADLKIGSFVKIFAWGNKKGARSYPQGDRHIIRGRMHLDTSTTAGNGLYFTGFNSHTTEVQSVISGTGSIYAYKWDNTDFTLAVTGTNNTYTGSWKISNWGSTGTIAFEFYDERSLGALTGESQNLTLGENNGAKVFVHPLANTTFTKNHRRVFFDGGSISILVDDGKTWEIQGSTNYRNNNCALTKVGGGTFAITGWSNCETTSGSLRISEGYVRAGGAYATQFAGLNVTVAEDAGFEAKYVSGATDSGAKYGTMLTDDSKFTVEGQKIGVKIVTDGAKISSKQTIPFLTIPKAAATQVDGKKFVIKHDDVAGRKASVVKDELVVDNVPYVRYSVRMGYGTVLTVR